MPEQVNSSWPTRTRTDLRPSRTRCAHAVQHCAHPNWYEHIRQSRRSTSRMFLMLDLDSSRSACKYAGERRKRIIFVFVIDLLIRYDLLIIDLQYGTRESKWLVFQTFACNFALKDIKVKKKCYICFKCELLDHE